jgi:hypothetical protein
MTKRQRTNNNLQNITQKTKDRSTWTSPKTGDQRRCYRCVISSCSTCGTRHVTLVTTQVISYEWERSALWWLQTELITVNQVMVATPLVSSKFVLYFDVEHTILRLFQKPVVCTKFDIYVFITITGLTPSADSPREYHPLRSQCFDTDIVY